MYKGNDVIGKPIITYDTGAVLEKIKDVLFDAPKKRILGFLVGEEGIFSKAKILPFGNIKAIGADAVTVSDAQAIVEAPKESRMEELAETENVTKGTKVMTQDGTDLGSIADLYFNERTGEIEGYEVSGGVFADAYSGKSFLPAPNALMIGKDVAFVPPETAQMMEEQVGGIKGAAQGVAEKARGLKDNAAGAVQGAAAETGRQMQNAKESAVGTVQNFSTASQEKIQEQVVGRRAHKAVYSDSGSVIAAEGQIVTEPIVEYAQQEGKQPELMAAVFSDAAATVSAGMRQGASQVAAGAAGLWEQIKSKASDLKDKAASKVEQQRIDAALGKPVTKVILDRSDNVILNTGELVTHEAIERARHEGALDMLLSSVTHETPKFSSEELKSKGVEE